MLIATLNITPPFVLAPMAGITSWPMRMLCRKFGAPFAFTEMVPAAAIARGKMQADVIYSLKAHPADRPLGLQLFGADPEDMARAAQALSAWEADLIDLNMGCPVKKVVHAGAGAALMKDLPRARAIIAAVRAATPAPLTVKMRLGWDDGSRNAVELARICEGEGVDAITVHGRTRAQGFAGETDLAGIRQGVQAVNIPVIGNGGINSAAAAERMFAETGCAGIMVARGARGNPWLFAQLLNPETPEPTLAEKAGVILQHLEYMLEFEPASRASLEMKNHLCWYSKGLPQAVALRRQLQSIASPNDIRRLVEQYFFSPE
jgi:tRNA-dihydrouridine synthase B